MYTPTIFFYYQELMALEVAEDKSFVTIDYMDPYGGCRRIKRDFGFWDKKGAKELYDEIIKVNNINKEREKHGPR